MSLPGEHEAREQLRAVAAELAVIDSRRLEIAARRDVALAAARASGASWAQLQGDSGLTVGAVAKALKRVAE